MLIRRCVWHRMYHWYPMTLGVASWQGFGFSFTDGMCRGCAIRFRRQWDLPPIPEASGFDFTRLSVAVVVAGMLVLTVSSSDSVRVSNTTPPTRTALAQPPILTPPTIVTETRPTAFAKRPAPASRARSAKARPATPLAEPDLFAEETESALLVQASLAEPPARAIASETMSPRGTRFYTRVTFAAVPSAGLTQQTP
jgi:hypothetical protein